MEIEKTIHIYIDINKIIARINEDHSSVEEAVKWYCESLDDGIYYHIGDKETEMIIQEVKKQLLDNSKGSGI